MPRSLRAPLYRTFGRLTGCDLSECRPPLEAYPSLGAFFVRRLVEGARPISQGADLLVSPVDGTVQAVGSISASGALLQAKGREYEVRDFLAGIGAHIPLTGGSAWTIYLGPRDYHRIHAPESCRLVAARWVAGARFSVNPRVLLKRDVFAVNERCVLELETRRGPLLAVLVGALNVGRIRVVGLDPAHDGPLARPLEFARGEELARFELGSTIVLLAPPGVARPLPELAGGQRLRLGQVIGQLGTPASAAPAADSRSARG